MSDLSPSSDATGQVTGLEGPASYRYRRAKLSGRPRVQISEYPLYSDVALAGAVNEGLGPFEIINAHPSHQSDPTLVCASMSISRQGLPGS